MAMKSKWATSVKRYGGTDLDHRIRAALNDALNARGRLTKLQKRAQELKKAYWDLQEQIQETEKVYADYALRLAELRQTKAEEEPGQSTPLPPHLSELGVQIGLVKAEETN